MSQLILHVDGAFTILQQQGCEGMAQVMESDAPEPGLSEEAMEQEPDGIVM